MQLPIHVIAGIVIQTFVFNFTELPFFIACFLIIVLSFCSHFVLDILARSTYHPPNRIQDNFWLYWHIFTYGSGFIFILIFLWSFWVSIFFSNLVDIWDWLFLRKIAKNKNQPEWGKEYYFHNIKDKLQIIFFGWMPDLTYKKIGILPELFIITTWYALLVLNLLSEII